MHDACIGKTDVEIRVGKYCPMCISPSEIVPEFRQYEFDILHVSCFVSSFIFSSKKMRNKLKINQPETQGGAMLFLGKQTTEWLVSGNQKGHLKAVQDAMIEFAKNSLSDYLYKQLEIERLVELKPALKIIRETVYFILLVLFFVFMFFFCFF